jgi:hypothetical protein
MLAAMYAAGSSIPCPWYRGPEVEVEREAVLEMVMDPLVRVPLRLRERAYRGRVRGDRAGVLRGGRRRRSRDRA